MDSTEYRIRGKEMVDYIADYLENIRSRRVFPDKKPGFVQSQISHSAPMEGEEWSKIFEDIETVIMPGVTHWQSPHMHAYFPALTSYPSMLGEMLSNAINCLGFTWASSPACTELEMVVMNWLGKMIGLPEEFLHKKNNLGGGVIQTTSSEATLISLLAGRWRAIEFYKTQNTEPLLISNSEINGKLIAYCSDQAHSSVEKAALIGLVKIKYVECDDEYSMRGKALKSMIKEDRRNGLIPFWVCATLGTTGACAFDNLQEIGTVCEEENIWLHVDAAYAGSAFICPEFRHWLKGINMVDSIAFNPSKWLMVHFDCTAMWVKDSSALHKAFNVDPIYLQHEYSGLAIDFMHWQIPLSKRFRALKLWFVIRNYGITGLQKHIRESILLAQKFESLINSDKRFEIPACRHLGLVVFRLIGKNEITEALWKRLNGHGNIHCVPSILKGLYVIRFAITSPRTTNEDIIHDWSEIQSVAGVVLKEFTTLSSDRITNMEVIAYRVKVPLAETRQNNEHFGTSLLLANSPISPKIMNGSFAAIFDQSDVLAEFSKTIRLRLIAKNSPAMRRRIRGILMSGKQFSLDSRLDLFHGIEQDDSKNVYRTSKNLPIVEDTSDSSEGSRDLSFKNDLVDIQAVKKKPIRSKSVDYQDFPILLSNKKCVKCGHTLQI